MCVYDVQALLMYNYIALLVACHCRETAWGDHIILYGALQRLQMESRYDVNVWCAGILT